ncbi:MAG: GntR family transcriptional regulator [Proteobacteria bacterium]|nr:GntR family transcriptional regulator [Pseudomonadota bacterium]
MANTSTSHVSRLADRTRRKVSDRTVARLRRAILAGEFAAGQDLPPERELAHRYGVSRLTLRAALALLENEGLVRPVHGSGTRVLDFRDTGGLELLGPITALAVGGGAVPAALLEQILELRRVLAVAAFGMGAERASSEQLEQLRIHLEQQARLTSDSRAFMRADLEFARLLVRTTGNLPLELLYNTIVRTLWSQPNLERLFAITDARATVQVYERLLELMRQRKAAAARKMAGRLMQRHDDRLLGRLRDMSEPPGAGP